MKALFTLLALCMAAQSVLSQNKLRDDKGTSVYFSGGTHIGFWTVLGQSEVPYNGQIDVLINNKTAIGVGYTYDRYNSNPVSFFSSSNKATRENARLRWYRYTNDPNKRFSAYMGFSIGVSRWKSDDTYHNENRGPSTFPTAQFLLGCKVRLNNDFFWMAEGGFGPPCCLQTSVGYKF